MSTNTARLGIIGYGAIGATVVEAIRTGELPGYVCPAVLVRRARDLQPASGPRLLADPDAFFAQGLEVVLECAGHDAVRQHALPALESGADLLVTSVGAFTDAALLDRVLTRAHQTGRHLMLPSAGIGALDILTAAAQGGLETVTITVRKDPESWKGTAAERVHDLDALPGAVTLYDGPVAAGAAAYPENVNIAAAVALAGLGMERTRLVIVADPAIETHVVEVEAAGTFGRFHFSEEVLPSEANRKTGRLVSMAVIKTLRHLRGTFIVGG